MKTLRDKKSPQSEKIPNKSVRKSTSKTFMKNFKIDENAMILDKEQSNVKEQKVMEAGPDVKSTPNSTDETTRGEWHERQKLVILKKHVKRLKSYERKKLGTTRKEMVQSAIKVEKWLNSIPKDDIYSNVTHNPKPVVKSTNKSRTWRSRIKGFVAAAVAFLPQIVVTAFGSTGGSTVIHSCDLSNITNSPTDDFFTNQSGLFQFDQMTRDQMT